MYENEHGAYKYTYTVSGIGGDRKDVPFRSVGKYLVLVTKKIPFNVH